MATISFERKFSISDEDLKVIDKARPTKHYYDAVQAVRGSSGLLRNQKKEVPTWMRKKK